MKVTPKVLAEMAMTEVANDRPGQAMIHLWLLRDMLDGITVQLEVSQLEPNPPMFDFRLPVQSDLPPMQKLPGRIKSTDISCPSCKAKPGQPCFRLTGRGPHGKPTNIPLVALGSGKTMIHKKRTALAREANR